MPSVTRYALFNGIHISHTIIWKKKTKKIKKKKQKTHNNNKQNNNNNKNQKQNKTKQNKNKNKIKKHICHCKLFFFVLCEFSNLCYLQDVIT